MTFSIEPIFRSFETLDKCSQTCDGGRQTRYRYCVGGTAGDIGCEGLTEEAFQAPFKKLYLKNQQKKFLEI